MCKKIQLSRGYFTLVDNEDYEHLNQWKWFYLEPGYAARTIRLKDNKFKKILMHRLLINAPLGIQVDHINENKLDNRKKNLRLCSRAENSRNRGKNKNNTSGYKGVFLNKNSKKWLACIGFNGKQISLGTYKTKELAAKAYNNASIKYFGEFAKVNIIKGKKHV